MLEEVLKILTKSYHNLFSCWKKNLNSYTKIKIDSELNFQYGLMIIVICIERFINCTRLVIVVYGTFLKERIRGILLVAITKDANNQVISHILNNIVL